MTVDREELRRLCHAWLDGDAKTVVEATPKLLDELDAKDRRIAEWEREYEKLREDLGSANAAVLTAGKVATELESRLATAHDMIRHFEQERDSWGAAYKQRAAKTDARIRELEAGLSWACDGWRYQYLERCKAEGHEPDPGVLDRIEGYKKLLPSEET